jgi:hypothetical protein
MGNYTSIYTNEGDKYVKTITILAVMSIFICSLNQFSNDYLVVCGNQECFRKEYRTTCADNLFVINKLFSLLMVKRKQM